VRRTFFYIALAGLAAFCLGPLIWQLLTSLKPSAYITRLPPLFPHQLTIEHYVAVFIGRPFVRIIFNSALVAGLTTIFALVIGSLAAFALARLPVIGKAVVLAAILSISMFPPIATVSPLFVIIRTLGLRDTPWALVGAYTTFSLPLTVWILTGFFRNISVELFRAARIDGCSPFQAFIRIFVPLAAPGVFATAILVFIYSWNEFLFALTFTSTPASRTIPVEIALFPGLHEMPWGDIAAASIIVTVPLVALVFAFQKRIVEGLTAGSIKG